ncbi:hypothetical protein IGI04_007617 [Brassica rapa subsp. trilocularis]|nr:hypothetical protein IGI04_007617 [Brassica rapa subsp. trilocularis]CAF2142348.1 unnamed protein product [Brassica napus]CAG7894746.1 unnamed protein product [Brassica rapa]CDY48786.1 BnaA02g24270D [Brassica napus]VDC90771.1 unnamed protein product [Brassica rapa]
MTNWPLIRMLPSLLAHRIYDVIVELLENSNLTFQFKGPLLAGPEFKEVFDVFKDVLINVDSKAEALEEL